MNRIEGTDYDSRADGRSVDRQKRPIRLLIRELVIGTSTRPAAGSALSTIGPLY
jgi:hypothetical protein